MGLFRPLLSSFLNVSALPPSLQSFLARHIINTGHHFNAGPRLGAYSFRFSCIPDKTQAVSNLKKKSFVIDRRRYGTHFLSKSVAAEAL